MDRTDLLIWSQVGLENARQRLQTLPYLDPRPDITL